MIYSTKQLWSGVSNIEGWDNLDFHKKSLEQLPKPYLDLFVAEDSILRKIIDVESKVCDIWSWDWRTIATLANITKNIVWVDFNLRAIQDLKQKESFQDFNFICANAISIPKNDNTFDAVTCMMSRLNFWNLKVKSLSEMNRILKFNWKLILSVFHEDALETRLQLYQSIWLKVKNISTWWSVTFDEDMLANTSEQFTKDDLYNYVVSAWFVINNIEKVGIWYILNAVKK